MGTGTARTYAPPPRLRELRCRAPKIPPPPGREVQCGGEGRGWDGDGDGYGEEVCFAGVPSGDPLPRHGELRRSAPEIPPPPGTGGAVRWGGEGRGGEGRGRDRRGIGEGSWPRGCSACVVARVSSSCAWRSLRPKEESGLTHGTREHELSWPSGSMNDVGN
jgi:hypothetical protein